VVLNTCDTKAGRRGLQRLAVFLGFTQAAGMARNDTTCLRAQGLQVVLYGDDFVESWQGTAGGKPSPACAGIPDVWQRHFGGLWRARAYGIAGASSPGFRIWGLGIPSIQWHG
jgi:hypothetical protein